MKQRIIQVDSFTCHPFSGNPAAVCVMPGPANEDWMRKVAQEMNLSETAFLYPEGDIYHLRWFTPAAEVDLCGHATLASAHVLWEEGYLSKDANAQFVTKSGELIARRSGDWIELNFPAIPVEEVAVPDGLIEALGVSPVYVGMNKFHYLVAMDSEQAVRSMEPDMSLLATFPVLGVIVTAVSSGTEYDFVSRFFGPAIGIPEDPVTGAAHCGLGPYWQHLLGKDSLIAYQASTRGGVIKVMMDGDRVRLAGQAVTVMRGELL